MQDFKDSELEWTLADPTTLATWKNQLWYVSITDFIQGKPFYQKEILNLDKRLQVVLYMDVNHVASSCITVQWPLVPFRVYNCPSATRRAQSDHSLPPPLESRRHWLPAHCIAITGTSLFLNKLSLLLSLGICTCCLKCSCPRYWLGLFPHFLQGPA